MSELLEIFTTPTPLWLVILIVFLYDVGAFVVDVTWKAYRRSKGEN